MELVNLEFINNFLLKRMKAKISFTLQNLKTKIISK